MIQILLAFAAGVLTIAAPCILLPLPILLASSIGNRSKTRPLFIALGFTLTFSILALGLQYAVQHLGINANVIRDIAAFVLAIMALFLIFPRPFEILMSRMNGLVNSAAKVTRNTGSGNLGGFVTGIVIGAVWAPCAGPILASILTLVSIQKNTGAAAFQIIAYGLGAGIPMILVAYGGQYLTSKIRSVAKYSTAIQQVFGGILLLVAASIYFQYDTIIQARLLDRFPALSGIIENKLLHNTEDGVGEMIPSDSKTALNDYGQAPDFTGITHWINSDPLTLEKLKGKVVLVDFWTYSCVNCIRTLPYVTQWYDTYKDQGLVVIGVHAPEFEFEKLTSNVETAIKRYKINYPVAQDNDFQTWRAYNNQYWPAHYLIDQNGHVVYYHFGEGKYTETENAIRTLLKQTPVSGTEDTRPQGGAISPEMYFGTSRLKNLSSGQTANTQPTDYVIPSRLELNNFALEGSWQFSAESVRLVGNTGKIKLHFTGSNVNIVAQSNKPISIIARIDNGTPQIIQISTSDLYSLFKGNAGDHVLEIEIPNTPENPGFEAFTFTFG